MSDFSKLSPEDLVAFIDRNFDLFASKRAPDFPEKILSGLGRGAVVAIRRAEGFAIAYLGQKNRLLNLPGDLIFLYVSPEHSGQGIGRSMIEEVRRAACPGLPLITQCEGMRRRVYFEKQGFEVEDEDAETNTFYLRSPPLP